MGRITLRRGDKLCLRVNHGEIDHQFHVPGHLLRLSKRVTVKSLRRAQREGGLENEKTSICSL